MNFTNLKQFMDDMASGRTPGNAIEVYVNGEQAFTYAAGYADLETRKPLTGKEYFYIYSCSKITTVTAGLQLLERGNFLLTDPLYDYIPEYKTMYIRAENGECKEAQNPITVGDLFTMSAGLTYNFNSEGFRKAAELTNGKMDTATAIRCLAMDPLAYEPGTRWQYSLGHDALAGLISILTGMPFREYVRKNIFEPLEMNGCAYHPTPEILEKMASQYTFVPEGQSAVEDLVEAQKYGKADKGHFLNVGKVNSHIRGEEYDSGGAGIITTVSDYVKLMAALANYGKGLTGERILSSASIDLLRTNRLNEVQRKDFNWKQLAGYGYGLGVRTMIDKAAGGCIGSLREFGWGGAAGATALIDPERNLAVFYAQHCLNPREEYYQPRLRNILYSCLDD